MNILGVSMVMSHRDYSVQLRIVSKKVVEAFARPSMSFHMDSVERRRLLNLWERTCGFDTCQGYCNMNRGRLLHDPIQV